jgi:hypothetical protein
MDGWLRLHNLLKTFSGKRMSTFSDGYGDGVLAPSVNFIK